MKTGILINDFESLGPRQSTVMLAQELVAQGHEVYMFAVSDLGMAAQGEVVAQARRGDAETNARRFIAALRAAPRETVRLGALDLVLCRTNPARDDRLGLQSSALQLLEIAAARGAVVLNDPVGLGRATSKAYLGLLPEFTRPLTITSGDRETLHRFVVELDGPAVLKPALGTRGLGVFRAEPSERNLNQILDLLLARGMVTAQRYVPRADEGDTRVLVVEGEIFEVEGCPAAVRRVPGADDFRSNIHAGGKPAPGQVSEAMAEVVRAVGPHLVRDGLYLVGLDFIGDVLCEANVYSPGGLYDIERFTGVPFTEHLARRLTAQARRRRNKQGEEPAAPPPGVDPSSTLASPLRLSAQLLID